MIPTKANRSARIVIAAQTFSVIGSAILRFAIPLWVWDETRSSTAVAYIALFAFAPLIFVSPMVGALVDRWRTHIRYTMMISHVGSATTAVIMGLLILNDSLSVWLVYILVGIRALLEAFEWPSYSSALTSLLKKEDYIRASAAQSTIQSVGSMTGPLLGAILYSRGDLLGVVVTQVGASFISLLILYFFAHFTDEKNHQGRRDEKSLWKESFLGFKYILSHPSLLGIQVVFFIGNIFDNTFSTLYIPMILARSGNDVSLVAMLRTAAGLSGFASGLLLVSLRGATHATRLILWGWGMTMVSFLIAGLGQGVLVWLCAAILGGALSPLINSANQSFWQRKVPPDIQGRVFAARRVLAWAASPIAVSVAGPLADHIFSPSMRQGGFLTPVFGGILGVGEGAGISLYFVLIGIVGVFLIVIASFNPFIRFAEKLVLDHDSTA